MIYNCWSELCQITKDCECTSDCCQGYTIHPLVIKYINDNEIKTNNPKIEYDVSEKDIYDLCIHYHCPFCNNYVEIIG